MDLVSLRYWQWMIIGVVAGSVAGYAWSNTGTTLSRSGNPDQFRGLTRYHASAEKSGKVERIKNIVVHPPEKNPSDEDVYPVTFERLDARDSDNPKYVSDGIYAKTPFEGSQDIRAYLKSVNMPFSDRVGTGQYLPVVYGVGAGFVGIGVIWPTLIGLMVGAGLAKPVPEEEKKKSKKIEYGEEDDSLIKDGKRAATKADAKNLDALNSEMEQKLAAGLSAGGPRAATATAEEPVSILMSGGGSRSTSDPTEAPAPAAPEEKKDYQGAWYPVARPAARPDDKPH